MRPRWLAALIGLTLLCATGDAAVICTALGTLTPTLSLCQPAAGEINWTAAINNNWLVLDTAFTGAPNQLFGARFSGTGVEPKSLVAGAGIAITPAAGSLTVSATGNTLAVAAPSSVRGLVCQNDATNFNTQYGCAADAVVLRNPADSSTVIRTAVATLTNNTATAGPAANGRDQAGAFSANAWLHFYYIWNGATLATVSSSIAPPTGPTLPATYTHWAYATAVRYNATPVLVRTRTRGAWVAYEVQQVALAGGSATVETPVSLVALVPPNALRVQVHVPRDVVASAVVTSLRVIAGSDFFTADGAGGPFTASYPLVLPNIAQQFLYLHSGGGSTLDVNVGGYALANGDS